MFDWIEHTNGAAADCWPIGTNQRVAGSAISSLWRLLRFVAVLF